MSAVMTVLVAACLTGQIGFDRVDLVAEDTGTFLHFEAPMAAVRADITAVRFLEQVKPVWTTAVKGLYVGTSIGSQSIVYEHPLLAQHGLFATGGLQTRLLLPRGALAGVAWRWKRLRVGLSLSALSQASWARPNWQQWQFLPSLGVGIGRSYEP